MGLSGLASAKDIDPSLAALFSATGPAKVPSKARYAQAAKKGRHELAELEEDDEDKEDESHGTAAEDLSDESEEETSDGDDSSDLEESYSKEVQAHTVVAPVANKHESTDKKEGRTRKRKQRDEDDDLESKYLDGLRDDRDHPGKRLKDADGNQAKPISVEDVGQEDGEGDDDQTFMHESLVHESLNADDAAQEVEKANRTVFLSNVSVEAITSAKAKKMLMAHLSSVLDKSTDPPQAIESLRFRSTAYASMAVPKRAAFAQGSVMDATTNSTNAYVVYNSVAAVRTAVRELNGTVVMDRHLRVDSVAHPARQDHKRCVFVGNLGFVNDETVLNTKLDDDGKEVTEKRKRTKKPMDVEEGLWRVFSKEAGKVESVRVVRDAVTRVGKGFAYVQFYDGNSVEKALLLADKRFPPMLPRPLRVSRCKSPHKTARAMEARKDKLQARSNAERKKANGYVPKPTAKDQSLAGRAGKLLGRAVGGRVGSNPSRPSTHKAQSEDGTFKSPEDIVFEGRRASMKDGKPRDLKFKGKKSGPGRVHKKQRAHTKDRASKWKAERGTK